MSETLDSPDRLERQPELLTQGNITTKQGDALCDGTATVISLKGGRFEVGTAHVTNEEARVTQGLLALDFDDTLYLLGLWVASSLADRSGDPMEPAGRAAMMTLVPRQKSGLLRVVGMGGDKGYSVKVTSLPR